METKPRVIVRQLVDWRAAMISGLISGAFALILHILLSYILLDSPWLFIRIVASLILGQGVLPPPATFSWNVFIVAVFLHLLLGLLYTSIIAVVVHQWGILISFLGGALIGLALYTINLYALSLLFPWFYTFRNWAFLVVHVAFGALSGSVYELLEVEKYVEVKKRSAS